MKNYNIAVVGATGMVGRKFLEVLAERKLPAKNYYLFASRRSAGSKVDFMGKTYEVIELTREKGRVLETGGTARGEQRDVHVVFFHVFGREFDDL